MPDNARFTPGPWVAKKDRLVYAPHVESWLVMAASNSVGIVCTAAYADSSNMDANAHLIAAAPEMYDLLIQLRSTYRDNDAAAREIDATLSKARGETP